jgi:CHAT domain-containing protein/Tfp pilus assembly protein PilF
MGRFEEAEANHRRALAIFEARLGKSHRDVATALNDLAAVCNLTGRFDEAETHFKRCIQISEDRLGMDHPQVGQFLNNLAYVYIQQKQYTKAYPLYERSLRINESRLGKNHPSVGHNLSNLGALEMHMGRFEKAEPLLQRALQVAESTVGEMHENTKVCISGLAGNSQALGKHAQAFELQERSLRIGEASIQDVLGFATETSLQAHLDAMNGGLPLLINILLEQPRDDGVEKAATWAVRLKGIGLDTFCRFRQAQHLVKSGEPLAQRVSRLRSLKQLVANAALSPPAGVPVEKVAEQVSQWRKESAEIESEIMQVLAKQQLGPRLNSDEVTTGALRKALTRDAACLEFVRMPARDFKKFVWLADHYVAFVIGAGEAPPSLVDLGLAKPIDAAIETLRKDFADLQDKLKDCETAEEARDVEKSQEAIFRKKSADLAKQLFAPLRKALGPAKLVYLAPDGNLNRLPFEALVDDDGKYLIERYQFAYLSSGRDLLRPAVKPAKGTVVFAAPDYKLDADQRIAQAEKLLAKNATKVALGPGVAPTVRSIGWKALPGALEEARDIESMLKASAFGPVKSYVGPEALEEVLKAMPAPRVLHLATHGFFLDHEPAAPSSDNDGEGAGWARGKLKTVDNPLLRSGIVLAGANQVGDKKAKTQAEDGWVTAEEIALLDLRGTELVVLSACQSGLGDVKSGEGVYGLRRAFLYAGVRTMVTSLFEVPDQETRELMKRFYKELSTGQGKLTALHTAQRGLLEERRQKQGTAHPFFWASFVLVGDPR